MPKKDLRSTPFSGINSLNQMRINVLRSLRSSGNAPIDITVNNRFPDGYYLLHHALLADEISALTSGISEEHSVAAELVQKLIARGADPCLPSGPNLYTPAHIAAYNGDLPCFRALIEREDSINIKALLTSNSSSLTPFQVALSEGNLEIVEYLLEKVTDLQSAKDVGMFAGLTEMDSFDRSPNKFFVKLHNLAKQSPNTECSELVDQKLQELGLSEQIEEELSKKHSFFGLSFSFRSSKKSEKYKSTDVVPQINDEEQENSADARMWGEIIDDLNDPVARDSAMSVRNASKKQTSSSSPSKPQQSGSIFDCLRNLTSRGKNG